MIVATLNADQARAAKVMRNPTAKRRRRRRFRLTVLPKGLVQRAFDMRQRLATLMVWLMWAGGVYGAEQMIVPKIDGEWWTVAGNPDLGKLAADNQQPVDFAVWRAADGTWQLWSCIRNTKCGGNTRLLYRWEGQALTAKNWTPKGIAMQAEPKYGEKRGGLQAPHVVLIDGVYHMFYGDWENICVATSRDGKTFRRRVNPNRRTGMFTEGVGANTRDPMVIRIGERWHCYYTSATPAKEGAVFCRTSVDTRNWTLSRIVGMGGRSGKGYCSAECAHVVSPTPGHYYLFRTQRYGQDALTSVYHSTDPMVFGVNTDEHFAFELPVAAPEIVLHEGRYYIASLLPSLKGIRIARLKWVNRR